MINKFNPINGYRVILHLAVIERLKPYCNKCYGFTEGETMALVDDAVFHLDKLTTNSKDEVIYHLLATLATEPTVSPEFINAVDCLSNIPEMEDWQIKIALKLYDKEPIGTAINIAFEMDEIEELDVERLINVDGTLYYYRG